jgi:hypothetical protein
MKKIKWITFSLIVQILFYSCAQNKTRQIDLGDIIAKGNIGSDTTYNGKIQFFDKISGQLLKECNYKDGILNGEYKHYYKNGKIMISASYNNDKPNGYGYYYDTSGNLISKTNSFYGLRVGSSIEYSNNTPKVYTFYSLDNKILFTLDYDSIGQKGILDVRQDFFFLHCYILQDSIVKYLVYNIQPPKYNFQYSLVLIDSLKKIKSIIQNFNSKEAWFTFQVSENITTQNEHYAIKIYVRDSINNLNCVMLKQIPPLEEDF